MPTGEEEGQNALCQFYIQLCLSTVADLTEVSSFLTDLAETVRSLAYLLVR